MFFFLELDIFNCKIFKESLISDKKRLLYLKYKKYVQKRLCLVVAFLDGNILTVQSSEVIDGISFYIKNL